jgi:hypothetical protein
MTTVTNSEVADLWLAGLSGDLGSLHDLSSPSMRVWHSHDEMWLTREQAEARVAASGAMQSSPAMHDLRATATERGFLVQGWVGGDRGQAKTHIVLVCTVEDGLVTCCEEYIAPTTSLAPGS